MGGEHGQQVAREIVHATGAGADAGLMLEAGGGDVETQVAEVRTMRRRMPRMPALLAPREQLRALFGRESAPAVFGLGHDWSVTRAA